MHYDHKTYKNHKTSQTAYFIITKQSRALTILTFWIDFTFANAIPLLVLFFILQLYYKAQESLTLTSFV